MLVYTVKGNVSIYIWDTFRHISKEDNSDCDHNIEVNLEFYCGIFAFKHHQDVDTWILCTTK